MRKSTARNATTSSQFSRRWSATPRSRPVRPQAQMPTTKNARSWPRPPPARVSEHRVEGYASSNADGPGRERRGARCRIRAR